MFVALLETLSVRQFIRAPRQPLTEVTPLEGGGELQLQSCRESSDAVLGVGLARVWRSSCSWRRATWQCRLEAEVAHGAYAPRLHGKAGCRQRRGPRRLMAGTSLLDVDSLVTRS